MKQREDQETGIIIEIKYARNRNLEAVSKDALKQIEDRRYMREQLFGRECRAYFKIQWPFYKKKYRSNDS